MRLAICFTTLLFYVYGPMEHRDVISDPPSAEGGFFGLWLWENRALLTTIRDRKHPPFRAQLDTCPLLANKEQPPPLPASACARGAVPHIHTLD